MASGEKEERGSAKKEAANWLASYIIVKFTCVYKTNALPSCFCMYFLNTTRYMSQRPHVSTDMRPAAGKPSRV
jgi:hypothetical protein